MIVSGPSPGVTVSTSPAFMNTTCDRVSPLMRAPHPEREHRPRRRSAGISFITKAKCRCTLSYVSSASIHTPHDRVNPLTQAPLGAHHPPYLATSLANVHIRAYIHADALVSRQLARGHAACDYTCSSLYGDRAETPYGNIAPEGIYCKRPYPGYDYMTVDSADSLYTDACCQLICCSAYFLTPTLNVNSFILLTCRTQGRS